MSWHSKAVEKQLMILSESLILLLHSVFFPLDVNECATENGACSQNCINTQGSYYCNCNSGYSLAVNKHACDSKYQIV